MTNKTGDHLIYEDDAKPPHNVQVDMGERDFGISEMKFIINNSGKSREEFYRVTKETAKKIGIKYQKP